MDKRREIFRVEGKVKKAALIGAMISALSCLITFFTFMFSDEVALLDSPLFLSYFEDPLLMFLNFLPVALVFTSVYILSNRLWIGFLTSSALWVAMSIVNKFKLIYRDEPFLFIDIVLFRESTAMADKYSIALTSNMKLMVAGLVAIAAILFFFFDYRIDSKKMRAKLLVTIAILGGFVYSGVYKSDAVYAKLGDKELINIWSQTQQFKSKGFVYPFIYSIKDSFDSEPEGYDEKKAKETLESYHYTDIAPSEKVNVVSIMLEAYSDFTKYESIEWNRSPYEYYHKLEEESYRGNLITNVFGGGTIETERSYLTGNYNNPKYRIPTNSYVWYFKEQGYRTEFHHPIYGWFYNRQNINPNIGFDDFYYFENKYSQVSEHFLEDYDFFDHIIEDFEKSVDEGEKYFGFATTYQNHGPYPDTEVESPSVKFQESYDEKTYNVANNYFAGIEKTDKAIEKLIEYFRDSEEPTVVVLFGDHNPSLGENNVGFEMLGIDDNLSKIDGAVNHYETQYIFWGNEAAKKALKVDFEGEGDTISPNFLMTELFEYVGWKGNEFMQYSSDVKKKIDVLNNILFKENGDYTKKLSSDGKTEISEFENIEYYYSRNRNN